MSNTLSVKDTHNTHQCFADLLAPLIDPRVTVSNAYSTFWRILGCKLRRGLDRSAMHPQDDVVSPLLKYTNEPLTYN